MRLAPFSSRSSVITHITLATIRGAMRLVAGVGSFDSPYTRCVAEGSICGWPGVASGGIHHESVCMGTSSRFRSSHIRTHRNRAGTDSRDRSGVKHHVEPDIGLVNHFTNTMTYTDLDKYYPNPPWINIIQIHQVRGFVPHPKRRFTAAA